MKGTEKINVTEGTATMTLEEHKVAEIVSDTIRSMMADVGQFPLCQIEKAFIENVKKTTESNAAAILKLNSDISGNGKEGLKERQLRTEIDLESFKKTVEVFMADVKKLGWALVLLLLSLLGTSLYNIVITHGNTP